MSRSHRTAVLAVFAALAVAGTVRAAAAGYQARLDAFRKEAAAQRKKLGLEKDQAKLYAAYPTPEVTFAEDAAGTVCPGKRATVKLPGKFVPGTLFVLKSDDVAVVKEQLTSTEWTAEVEVKPVVAPGEVDVEVVTPVSTAYSSTRLLIIGCTHEWTLNLSSGETLTVRTTWPKDGSTDVTTDGAWTKAGKALGKVQVRVRGASRYFTFERVADAAEQAAQANAFGAALKSPEMKALDARFAKVQEKLTACGKQPPAQMGACMKGPGDEMTAISKEKEALFRKAQSAGAPTFGCDALHVDVSGGQLRGDAEKCPGGKERLTVTGSFKAVP